MLVTTSEKTIKQDTEDTLDIEDEPSEHDIAVFIKRQSDTVAVDTAHVTTDMNAPHLCRISIYYSYARVLGWKALNQMLSPIRQPFSLEIIYPTSFSDTEYSRLQHEIRSRMPNVTVFLTPADLPKLRLPPNSDDASDSGDDQDIESNSDGELGDRERDDGDRQDEDDDDREQGDEEGDRQEQNRDSNGEN